MSNIEENKEKKTLVYFASGHYKESYEYLPYDQIFLVDYCFANRNNTEIEISKSRKVICLGMDCLLSIDYLKHLGVKIDCYVVLNEGMYEGNGRIALNSDLVLGLIAPILKNDYVHIMNQDYYGHCYRVTMDLPFEKSEIHPGEPDYLDPFLFSSDSYHKGHAKVFRMKRKQPSVLDLKLNPYMKVSIIHDSIWCHIEELDLIGISFVSQGQGDYFNRIHKVISLREHFIAELLEHCVKNKLERIGLTPWGQGHYNDFIDLIRSYSMDYPKEISLFHLNNNDFNSLKNLM